MSDDSNLITRLQVLLNSIPDLKIGVLYGSFAKGTETPKSDIDLGLASNHPLTLERRVALVNTISASMNREVDLIDLNTASGTVLKQALTTGTIFLKKDSMLYARILSRMVFEEEDFQKNRSRIMEARRKRAFHA